MKSLRAVGAAFVVVLLVRPAVHAAKFTPEDPDHSLVKEVVVKGGHFGGTPRVVVKFQGRVRTPELGQKVNVWYRDYLSGGECRALMREVKVGFRDDLSGSEGFPVGGNGDFDIRGSIHFPGDWEGRTLTLSVEGREGDDAWGHYNRGEGIEDKTFAAGDVVSFSSPLAVELTLRKEGHTLAIARRDCVPVVETDSESESHREVLHGKWVDAAPSDEIKVVLERFVSKKNADITAREMAAQQAAQAALEKFGQANCLDFRSTIIVRRLDSHSYAVSVGDYQHVLETTKTEFESAGVIGRHLYAKWIGFRQALLQNGFGEKVAVFKEEPKCEEWSKLAGGSIRYSEVELLKEIAEIEHLREIEAAGAMSAEKINQLKELEASMTR